MNARTNLTLTLTLALALAGCGGGGGGGGTGGSGGGGGGNPPPAGTTISATFSNADGAPMPNVVATSNGALTTWSVASLSGSTLQFTLPPGVTAYGIAYYCQNNETIFEASVNDTTKPALGCFGNATATNVTFSYDVSAIAGATQAEIDVANASTTSVSGPQNSVTGSYTFASPYTVPGGTVDIMVKALDNAGDVIGAEILRGRTVSSGGTYPLAALSSSETTTIQSLSASNAPAGWTPSFEGGIILGDGSRFFLPYGTSSYAVPAASQVQPSDYYFAGAQASPANHASTTAAAATASSPPASLQLPPPFLYAGPAPADDPTFVFGYNGTFNVTGTVLYEAQIEWGTNNVSLAATKAAAGANPSIKIPNLAAISSLFPNLPSGGVNVTWNAYIVDENAVFFGAVIPPNFSGQFTYAGGNFVAP